MLLQKMKQTINHDIFTASDIFKKQGNLSKNIKYFTFFIKFFKMDAFSK